MYLNFSVDGYFVTSRRCSTESAPAILASLCNDYSAQSSDGGVLYGVTAGYGCTSEQIGSWSLTKERQHETWSYQSQLAQEHRQARAARV